MSETNRIGCCILCCYTFFVYLYIILVHDDIGALKMKSVSISELRANLLKYLEIVQQGKRITVTSKGRPLATLTPPVSQHTAAKARLRKLAKTAAIHDVVSPTDESWDALK